MTAIAALEATLADLDAAIGAQIAALRDLAARMEATVRFGREWAELDQRAVEGERELERLMTAQSRVVEELLCD